MFENFVAQQTNPNTRRAYSADLARWSTFLNGREATESLVIEWRDQLTSELANVSALRVFSTVRNYHKWAEIEPNPFRRVKPPKRISNWTPVVPDEETLDKLLEVCDNSRDRAIISLLANGLRVQEVVDLQGEDIIWEPDYQAWILRVTGKGDKMRLVPATDETVRELKRLDYGEGPVFPRLTIRKVYYLVAEKWGLRAGVGVLNPHSLRHAYATRLVRAGVGVLPLQRLMGHARSDTTALYTNLDLSDLVAASRLDPRNGEI